MAVGMVCYRKMIWNGYAYVHPTAELLLQDLIIGTLLLDSEVFLLHAIFTPVPFLYFFSKLQETCVTAKMHLLLINPDLLFPTYI